MHGKPSGGAARLQRYAIALVTAAIGVGTAAIVAVAVAKTFTLNVAKGASVTNFNTHKTIKENIGVTSGGLPVYTLTGDTPKHQECTKADGCFMFWLPIKAAKPSKAAGIHGTLGTFSRNGFKQVTLGGHPLYTFVMDKKDKASGEAVSSFGGTWHVVKTSGSAATVQQTTSTSTTGYGY